MNKVHFIYAEMHSLPFVSRFPVHNVNTLLLQGAHVRVNTQQINVILLKKKPEKQKKTKHFGPHTQE